MCMNLIISRESFLKPPLKTINQLQPWREMISSLFVIYTRNSQSRDSILNSKKMKTKIEVFGIFPKGIPWIKIRKVSEGNITEIRKSPLSPAMQLHTTTMWHSWITAWRVAENYKNLYLLLQIQVGYNSVLSACNAKKFLLACGVIEMCFPENKYHLGVLLLFLT